MIGIYQIFNTLNGKAYVGSSRHIDTRWKQHIGSLGRGDYHSILLQRAWDKYGSEAFDFEVIQECSENQLIDEEQFWLNILNFQQNQLSIS